MDWIWGGERGGVGHGVGGEEEGKTADLILKNKYKKSFMLCQKIKI